MKTARCAQINHVAKQGAISLFCVLFATACDREGPADKGPPDRTVANGAAAPVTGQSFGTADLGFVSWLESAGNFVVVHQFDQDTNGDQKIAPKFGDHGEPVGDLPSVWTYPLPTGQGERWDEFITSDPQNRWAVLRRGEQLVALSAHKRWPLKDADSSPDPSPCAPARQASIDPTGRWLVYLRTSPDRAVIKSLGTGEEREVAAVDLLWRAHAMPAGWVMLREIPTDTDGNGAIEMPRRQGTCICRWCSRFASSVGSGHLVGDAAREVIVTPSGRRVEAPPAPIGMGVDAIWSMAKQTLVDLDGKSRPLPKRCALAMLPLGRDEMVLRCPGGTVLWNVTSNLETPIKEEIDSVDRYTVPIDDWAIAVTRDESGDQHIARLNLADGRVELGPKALRIGTPHPSGWRLSADDQRVHTFDLTTGTSVPIDLRASELQGLLAKTKAGWVPINPSKPTALRILPARPAFVAANGCFIESSSGAKRGPYMWMCP